MRGDELLLDAFSRIRESVHDVIDGLTLEQSVRRPDEHANSVAWLVWHLARVQDDHVADVANREQVWTADGWAERFALPFSDSATGYGDSAGQVAQVRVEPELLAKYLDAVHEQTVSYVSGLADDDFDRVVDGSWDPPVTLGVRLVSVVSDCLQHVGQAAYLRGIVERRQISGP